MRSGTAVSNILRAWRLIRGMTGEELRRLQTQPASVAIAGRPDARAAAASRLALPRGAAAEYDTAHLAHKAGEALVFDADALVPGSDKSFAAVAAAMLARRPDLRVAVAVRLPVLRPVVAEILTREMALRNAKLAAVSALPGIVPLTDWLLPATSAGDLVALTRNQINLLLEISAAFGLAPDPRERLIELAPVVGGAFGWRAIAREAIALVPGGVGVAVKSAVAYAGTYAVGRAAAAYYSTGRAIDSADILRESLRSIVGRGAKLIGKGPA